MWQILLFAFEESVETQKIKAFAQVKSHIYKCFSHPYVADIVILPILKKEYGDTEN